MSRRPHVCFSTAAVALMLLAPQARAAGDADEKAQCISASDQGQQLRDDGAYLRAGEAFARCSRDSCPALVKHDCVAWLLDLQQRTPSVVFGASDPQGNDLVEVKVTIDGVPLLARLDGKPARIDPGAHQFRFEAAGFQPFETHVVIRAGEKNRILTAQFVAATAPTADAGASVEPAAPSAQVTEASASPSAVGVPLATWIFSGAAVVTFASEAYFGISALSQRNGDLGPGGCAPRCSTSEVSSIRTKFVIADVSLGAGLVSAGLAAYFFFRPPPSGAGVRTAFDVGLRPGGGLATVGGAF
jgi:hypothetical protein